MGKHMSKYSAFKCYTFDAVPFLDYNQTDLIENTTIAVLIVNDFHSNFGVSNSKLNLYENF